MFHCYRSEGPLPCGMNEIDLVLAVSFSYVFLYGLLLISEQALLVSVLMCETFRSSTRKDI